ncbi:MAG TPA: PAS domain-containing hybrid sensor histidine kinase/response regulator [Desulfobulbus sp.]|nr:PAS domain-containing hybrid sensor histidine kinase/response regulator [Desulfobulbus sp.]
MKNKLHILLIDDNPDDRLLVIRALEKEFPLLDVEQVIDEKTFANALKKASFQFVITDFQLGWTDGLRILHRVRGLRPHCPIIMFTGTGSQEVAVEAMKNGLDDYVIKSPHHFARLSAAVRSALIRKEHDNRLRQANDSIKVLSSAIEQSPVMVVITDPRARIEYVNPRFTEITGYRMEEVLGEKTSLLKSGQTSSQEYERLWRRILRGKTWRGEFCNRRKNGELYWEKASISVITDDRGNVQHYLALKEDITMRKLEEESRREAHELLQRTIDGVPEPILVINLDYRIKLMNHYARKEYIPDSDSPISSLYCYQVSHNRTRPCDTSRHPCPLQEVRKTMQPVRTLHKHRRKDGERRDIEIIASPLLDEHNRLRGIIESSRDVTERTKMEGELLNARKLDALGVLAGGIAHDFNNLLAVILGNISMGLQADHDQEKTDCFLAAEKAAMRSRDLTRQLLTFARGGAPVKKSAMIQSIIEDSAAFALSGSSSTACFFLPVDLWPVEVDAGQISQVINNLVLNGAQALPHGGIITIRAGNCHVDRTTALPLEPGRYVRIDVEDKGTGIPQQYLGRIFDPYFTTKKRGTGLGLASCFSITRKHGGHISVCSTPDQGTIFTLYLPASGRRPERMEKQENKNFRGQGRILVMDDEEMIRTMVSSMLTILGFTVEAVPDGEQAIALYQEALTTNTPFQAVVMDLTIPGGMGGVETIARLQQIDPGVKALVSSGYANDPVLADYQEYGFSGVICKPFELQDLQQSLQALLRNS